MIHPLYLWVITVLIIPSSWGFPTKLYSDLSRIKTFSGAVAGEHRAFHLILPVKTFSGTVVGEAKDGFTRGVLHNLSLYFVFVLLSFFCLVLLGSFYQN